MRVELAGTVPELRWGGTGGGAVIPGRGELLPELREQVRGWHGGQTSVASWVSGVMLGVRAHAMVAVLHRELSRPR